MKYVTNQIIKLPRPAVWWGWTPTGKRIHLGDRALWEEGRMVHVDTFCGAIMKAPTDHEIPPPGRVSEFCRQCFRTLAWALLEQRMKEIAKTAKVVEIRKGVSNDRARSRERAAAGNRN